MRVNDKFIYFVTDFIFFEPDVECSVQKRSFFNQLKFLLTITSSLQN